MVDYLIIGLFIGGMWVALTFLSSTYGLTPRAARYHFILLCLTPLVVVAWPVVVFGGGLLTVGYVVWLVFLLARDLWKEGWGG